MENKPIKRSKYIIKLSRDHNASLLFCWKIRQGKKLGVDGERIKPYVAYFAKDHMAPHFEEEETILFSSVSEDELVKQAVSEHQLIYKLVDQVRSAEGAELDESLLKLADTVDGHVRFEERTLFPHLEKLIPEPQLKQISEKLDHEPEKDTFGDEFWKKS